MRRAGLILACLLAPCMAAAVQPDEILPDAALEARARDISKELRCLVCRNESIDESNADLARDLRLVVRERLVAGDSDDAVKQYLVARYGEYVLLRPTASGANLVLWLAGPALLLLGGAMAAAFLRRQRSAPPTAALSAEEEAKLARLLDDDRPPR